MLSYDNIYSRDYDIGLSNLVTFQVLVYFESQSVLVITEEAKYNFESILTSVGGALSLYLGISLVAMFEYFELLARLMFHRISKK